MRVAVLGVGLIGGSLGLAARAKVDQAEVVGFDPDRAALDAALERGAIDLAARSVAEATRDADACFACAPVRALPALVGEALGAAPEECVVSDVGSTKRAMAALSRDERFIGGHPVAGAETAGLESARAELFEGAPWYLTPTQRSSGVLYERLTRVIIALGAQPVAIDPETHDRLLAVVSHLPHVLANVLVSQAARTRSQDGDALPRVGPSFRDTTRVAGAPSSVWMDIYLTNREPIARAIDETVRRLQDVATALRLDDEGELRRWNEKARGDRERLLEAELAGGPVHTLTVSVQNRPGTVAEVALALGRAGVNIADLALAPAPDMRSGSITVWVSGDDAADRAAGVLEQLGYAVAKLP